MHNRSNFQSVLRFLLFAGALSVWSLSGIQTAHATCGDYLSHAEPMLERDLELPLLDRAAAVPQQRPCSGPQCQNHQPDPIPATPLIVITMFKPACSVSADQLNPAGFDSNSAPSETLLLSSACRQRIDRPPRMASL